MAFGLRVKQEKYEALNKGLKNWLLILRIENVQVNGSLFKEKTLEFANELNIEGYSTLSFSFKTFIYFSSANKGNRQGTLFTRFIDRQLQF